MVDYIYVYQNYISDSLFFGDGLLSRLEINNFLQDGKKKNDLLVIPEEQIYSLASQAKTATNILLDKYKPDVVIVSLGMEDLRRSTEWSLYFQDLEAILTKIIESGSVAILLGMKPPWLPDNWVFGIEDICKRKGVFLISDYLEGFWKEDLDQTFMSLDLDQKNVLAKRLYLNLSSLFR